MLKHVNTENLIWKAHGINGLNEGYAIFSNDVIVDLSLTFEGDATITAQDSLELFGEPTWVIIAGQPNNHCFAFDLLYPTKGLYISLDKKSGQTEIYPSQSVFMVRFLETKITENWNVYDGGQVEWDGYKDYCP